MTKTTALITDEVIARFENDGVVCLRGVFDADWLAAIETGMEQNFKEPGKYAHYYASDQTGKNLSQRCRQLAAYSRIPSLCVRLAGGGICRPSDALFEGQHLLRQRLLPYRRNQRPHSLAPGCSLLVHPRHAGVQCVDPDRFSAARVRA